MCETTIMREKEDNTQGTQVVKYTIEKWEIV